MIRGAKLYACLLGIFYILGLITGGLAQANTKNGKNSSAQSEEFHYKKCRSLSKRQKARLSQREAEREAKRASWKEQKQIREKQDERAFKKRFSKLKQGGYDEFSSFIYPKKKKRTKKETQNINIFGMSVPLWTVTTFFTLLMVGDSVAQFHSHLQNIPPDTLDTPSTRITYGTPAKSVNETLVACSSRGTFQACQKSVTLSSSPNKVRCDLSEKAGIHGDLTPDTLLRCAHSKKSGESTRSCLPWGMPLNWVVTYFGGIKNNISATVNNLYPKNIWRMLTMTGSEFNAHSNPDLCFTGESQHTCIHHKFVANSSACAPGYKDDSGCENRFSVWSSVALETAENSRIEEVPYFNTLYKYFNNEENTLIIPWKNNPKDVDTELKIPLRFYNPDMFEVTTTPLSVLAEPTAPGLAIMIRGKTYKCTEEGCIEEDCAHVITVKED